MNRLCRAALCWTIATALPVATAAPLDPSGDPDITYDGDGKAFVNVATTATFSDANAILQQPDGRILVGGGYFEGAVQHFALTRYNSDGSIDGSFGAGGEVKTIAGGNDVINALALQSDGKIVAAGWDFPSNGNDFAIARYNTDGSLDTSFSGDGILLVNVSPLAAGFDRANAVAVQPDGKILVAGYSDNTGSSDRDGSIIRLNSNGTLDTSFSGDGKILVEMDGTTAQDRFNGIVVDGSGNIYAAGRAGSNAGIAKLDSAGNLVATFDGDGVVVHPIGGNGSSARYNALRIDGSGRLVGVGAMTPGGTFTMFVARANATTGALDTTFDGDGSNSIDIQGGQEDARAMGIQADGKIIASGYCDNDGSGLSKFFAARFGTNGALDTTFGDGADGKIVVNPGTQVALGIAGNIQTDGKYLISGYAYNTEVTSSQIAVARLTTSGLLDTSYDGDGISMRQLTGGSVDFANAVTVNASGQLYVVGNTGLSSHTDMVIVRHGTNGALDTGFDGDGLAKPTLATTNEAATGVAVQADGKPLVSVERSDVGATANPRMAVFRFTTAGALDTSYDGDGIAEATFGTNSAQPRGVLIDGSGRAVVFGATSDVSTNWDFAVARFNTNGTLDTTFDTDGKQRVSIGAGLDEGWAGALQSDGKILVGGYTTISGGTHFAVIRLNTNGSLDTGFDGDGIAIYQLGSGNLPRAEVEYIGQLPTGRILIAGKSNPASPDRNMLRVGRLLANGAVDTSFGTNGFAVIDTGAGRIDQWAFGALQFDEKLVMFGSTTIIGGGSSNDFLMARVNWDDGSLDTTFGTAGLVQPILSVASDAAYGGLVLPDGRQVMAGYAQAGDMGSARFLADPAPTPAGTPDLVAASDSGRSSTDNITNDNTPTFTGSCVTGETAILLVNGSEPATRARHLCRTGTYTLTAPTLADGTYTVSVREINGAGQATASAGLSITIDTVAAAPAITSPTNGASITIPPAATVSGNGAEATADIDVRVGTTAVCTAQAAASPAQNAAFSCTPSLGLGNHAITARQTDVAGNVSANSTTITYTQNVATTTALVSSVNPTRFGQSVTFTATVTSVPAGFATPSGCVTFTVAAQPSACIALSSGVATFARADLPVGTHAVSVAFTQQNFFLASNQVLASGHQVIKADTTLTATSNANPSVFGQPVTLTLGVNAVLPGAGTPGGNVALAIGGNPATNLPLAGGSAQSIRSDLPVGTHTVSGTYGGDAAFNGSSGSLSGGQVVNKANVVTTLIPPAFTPVSGQSFTLGVVFANQAPSLAIPTGVATLTVDGTPVQTFSAAAGTQNVNLMLTAGPHAIALAYPGDAGFNAGNTSLPAFPVNRAGTSLGILIDLDPSLSHETKTFTLEADPVAPGTGVPAGSVELTIGNLPPVTVPLTAGVGTHATSAIPPGSWTVSASYAGSTEFMPANTNLLGGITVIDTQLFRDSFE